MGADDGLPLRDSECGTFRGTVRRGKVFRANGFGRRFSAARQAAPGSCEKSQAACGDVSAVATVWTRNEGVLCEARWIDLHLMASGVLE